MNKYKDKYYSKTIEKGLSILCLFDREHTRLNLTEISRNSGINKTSTFRFVNTLIKLGYLRKNSNTKTIKLGPKALLLGNNFTQGFDLLQITKPLIDNVFTEYTITIDSALLDGHTLLALYRREAPNTLFFRQPLASQDLYARAMGKAILAQFNKTELFSFLNSVPRVKHTANTLVKKKDLLAEMEAIRNRGYSINNEEYLIGLVCIGAPLMNFKTKSVVGAISFDFPTSEYSLKVIESDYAGIITRLAVDISAAITIEEN
jgi:IclR family pca regulon transcriptional regulator